MSKYLLSEYIPPSRPYSNKELNDMCLSIYDEFNLSDTFAIHSKCGHIYRVKKNGKKEKDITEIITMVVVLFAGNLKILILTLKILLPN